jgi:hypothetical protein
MRTGKTGTTGREIYYSLEIEKMKEIDKWLTNSEKFGKPSLINSTKYYQQLKNKKNDKQFAI